MSRGETGKQRQTRIELAYYKRPDAIALAGEVDPVDRRGGGSVVRTGPQLGLGPGQSRAAF